jgi:hypothetical protein
LATQRSDGMLILDSAKAVESVSEIGKLGKFGEQPIGYLHGQVFNNEDEVILPTVSVKFAPSSPTSLAPNAGSFVVRISIDRPQRKDLTVKCELTGTAPSADYTYAGLDADKFATIPAGLLIKDLTFTPISNTTTTNETVIIKALALSIYRIGADNIATAIISSGTAILSIINTTTDLTLLGTLQGTDYFPATKIERTNSVLFEALVLGFEARWIHYYASNSWDPESGSNTGAYDFEIDPPLNAQEEFGVFPFLYQDPGDDFANLFLSWSGQSVILSAGLNNSKTFYYPKKIEDVIDPTILALYGYTDYYEEHTYLITITLLGTLALDGITVIPTTEQYSFASNTSTFISHTNRHHPNGQIA